MATPTVASGGDDGDDEEKSGEEAGEAVDSMPDPEGESVEDTSANTEKEAEGSELTDDLEEMAEEVASVADVTEEDIDEGRVGVQTADLSDDDDDEDGLGDWFDGVEESDLGGDDSDETTADDDGSGSGVSMGGGDTDLAAAADKLDNIAARMATQGLPDDEKDELEQEFEEFFGLIGLGDSWVDFLEEYILVDGVEEDVDPATRALGTTLAALVLVVYMRPDGQEVASSTWENAQKIGQKIGNKGDN